MNSRTDLEFYNLNDRKVPVIPLWKKKRKKKKRFVDLSRSLKKDQLCNDLFSHCHLLHQISSFIIPYTLPRWCSDAFKIIDTELNFPNDVSMAKYKWFNAFYDVYFKLLFNNRRPWLIQRGQNDMLTLNPPGRFFLSQYECRVRLWVTRIL